MQLGFEDCLSPVQAYLFCLENVLIFFLYVIRVVDPIAINLTRALFSSSSPSHPLRYLKDDIIDKLCLNLVTCIVPNPHKKDS